MLPAVAGNDANIYQVFDTDAHPVISFTNPAQLVQGGVVTDVGPSEAPLPLAIVGGAGLMGVMGLSRKRRQA